MRLIPTKSKEMNISFLHNANCLTEVKKDAKEFDKVVTCLSNHFKVKKNVPLARQKLLTRKPNAGETINNFVMLLKGFAEHCDYRKEEDNWMRVIVISHVTNKELH